MNGINVKVTRTNPDPKKLPIDLIQVTCFKDSRGFVTLAAYPGEDREGSVALIVTAGEYARIEPMKRLNRKRLEAIESLARNEISLRTGRAWELVQQVADKHGLSVPA